MTALVSRIPFPLSGRTSSAAASYTLSDKAFDVAINGIPFLLAISDERPYVRELAEIRKEQVDQQEQPGEQSLANWWLRSQSSFIGGAGILYQDPSSDNQYAIRYADSVGVNPWTNGRLTLLKSTAPKVTDASANPIFVAGARNLVSGTPDRYWVAVGSTYAEADQATGGGPPSLPITGTVVTMTTDGVNAYMADSTQVYKKAPSGMSGTTTWGATGSSAVVLGWVKGRVMMGLDNKIYEFDSAGTKTLRFTHLNTSWTWSAFAEGGSAIYAAGGAGASSAIYKFTVDSTGAVPTLAAGGVVTAQLPAGEVVLSMQGYLNTFVGIGTSRGFRVGQIDESGDIVYGPLLIENTSGVRAITAWDRFFYVGATNAIDGQSGLYRVDLGQPIQDNGVSPGVRFAYATDLQCHVTGTVSSVTTLGTTGRLVIAVIGVGTFLEHATDLETTGYLTTGRVRYNTLEPKLYKFASVKTPSALTGSVGLSVIDPGGGETPIITVSQGASTQIEDVLLQAPTGAVEWLKLKLTLGRSATNTATGGEVNGWQLKALPGAPRQRVFTVPLSCFDKEKDRTGQVIGRTGRTLERLEALEQIAQRGDVVSYQELRSGTSYLVVIDGLEFRQTAAPGRPRGDTHGGILYIKLRTVADVIAS